VFTSVARAAGMRTRFSQLTCPEIRAGRRNRGGRVLQPVPAAVPEAVRGVRPAVRQGLRHRPEVRQRHCDDRPLQRGAERGTGRVRAGGRRPDRSVRPCRPAPASPGLAGDQSKVPGSPPRIRHRERPEVRRGASLGMPGREESGGGTAGGGAGSQVAVGGGRVGRLLVRRPRHTRQDERFTRAGAAPLVSERARAAHTILGQAGVRGCRQNNSRQMAK
jgi:hypothetical protein